MNCNHCGVENDESSKFCFKCGHGLSKEEVNEPLLLKKNKWFILMFYYLTVLVFMIVGGSLYFSAPTHKESESDSQEANRVNTVVQIPEQIDPDSKQSYQERLHVMTNQELESELIDARGSFDDALKSSSKNAIQEVERRVSAIENELMSRQSAEMTQHDKDVISAAEKNYNPQLAKWIAIDVSGNLALYIDANSIQDMGNSIKRIHVLLNLKERIFSAPMMSSIDINEFDCRNTAVRLVRGDSFSELDGKGKHIGSTTPETLGLVPGKFTPIGQDENARPLQLQYKFACGR